MIVDEILNKQYDNYVPLGSRCYIALDLIKIKQRVCSYPLDWVICRFSLIEDIFQNEQFPTYIFSLDNLYQDVNYKYRYYSKAFDSWFLHDFDDYIPLSKQLGYVKKKYRKRTKRMFHDILRPSLFIHQCETQEDVDYIEKNYERLRQMVKKYNNENEILFLINIYQKGSEKIFIKTAHAPEGEELITKSPLIETPKLNTYFSNLLPKQSKKKTKLTFRRIYYHFLSLYYYTKGQYKHKNKVSTMSVKGYNFTEEEHG